MHSPAPAAILPPAPRLRFPATVRCHPPLPDDYSVYMCHNGKIFLFFIITLSLSPKSLILQIQKILISGFAAVAGTRDKPILPRLHRPAQPAAFIWQPRDMAEDRAHTKRQQADCPPSSLLPAGISPSSPQYPSLCPHIAQAVRLHRKKTKTYGRKI